MTPDAALIELLERVGAAGQDAVVLVTDHELNQWSTEAVTALKAHKLIHKTRPASSVICTGCEQECVMPVHTVPDPSGDPALFIVCDKRSDINRVTIPISRLEQWQASGASVADFLAGLLGLRRPAADQTSAGRWEVGMLKGKKHSSHLVLLAGDSLTFGFAGHSIALADVLAFEEEHFTIDKRTLTRLVDQPIAGAGDAESAAQRRERLKKRVQAEKAKGTKAFLIVVAEEEGISTSRLKQLLKDNSEPPKTPFTW